MVLFDSGLDMDIYQPSNDTTTNRPLLIFAHGGAFVAGNKNNPTSLCEAFQRDILPHLFNTDSHLLKITIPNAYDISLKLY